MPDNESTIKSTSQLLEEGLSEVFSADYYERFLAFVAGNPNYSYRNVILILQQCPHATRTKGLRSWNKEFRRIKSGETGLRINACFDKDEEEKDKPPVATSRRKHRRDSAFRRVSVFDYSQTIAADEADGGERHAPNPFPPAVPPFNVIPSTDNVAGYDTLLADLKRVSPLPLQFRDDISVDGGIVYNAIIINGDMSQRQTIRTIINQIARVLLGASCADDEQLEIAAESVTFIVSRALGLDAIAVGLRHIEKYSQDRERKVKEKFLDAIQKTALYFIDTLEGVREAHRIGYSSADFFLFNNKKTAFRLFRQGYDLYLIYPKDGELLVMNKKQLEKYEGPFAVYRGDWFGGAGRVAA